MAAGNRGPRSYPILRAELDAMYATRDQLFAAWFEAGEWIAYIKRVSKAEPNRWQGVRQPTPKKPQR
jgi:hypothetical protein